MAYQDVFEVGDRVVIDAQQLEECKTADGKPVFPELDATIEMTIVERKDSKEFPGFFVYKAESDPCPHCGARKQIMTAFGAIWFKKVKEVDHE